LLLHLTFSRSSRERAESYVISNECHLPMYSGLVSLSILAYEQLSGR